jgi:two-component system sensor histidine kinase KdpD
MTAFGFSHKRGIVQFAISIGTILLVSLICYFLEDLIGYRAVAFLLLFAISILSILVNVYAVLTSAVLSAVIWDFFFIPPRFTFHVNSPDDVMMFIMYLAIALLGGFLTSQIRKYEKQVQLKEDKLKTLKLYSALFNSVSHEFRTPMTSIIGVSESLIHNNNKLTSEERLMLNQDVLQAAGGQPA